MEIDDDEDYWASVQRSALDPRVWIAVLPGHDNATNMNASTSRRRCQAYAYRVVAASAYNFNPDDLKWVHDKDRDEWILVLP